jgi:hypothetical protein
VNRELALKIADAVLYEGYMLYPYRRSALKNRQHWTFGILYPPDYEEVRLGTERSSLHSECLLRSTGDCKVDVQLRFLQLVRQMAARETQQPELEATEEGIVRSVEFEIALGLEPQRSPFCMGANDPPSGSHAECNMRLRGALSASTNEVDSDLHKLSIDVLNETGFDGSDRDSALLGSLLSAHLILTARNGEFVSLLDPPAHVQEHAQGCSNVGNFPVLLGVEGNHDMMLCSPIILYDYPRIAPESAGDFFDATEMDEMLTLRVMTLTDQEKKEVQSSGEHARNLLERTERTAREQLIKTHGTIRSVR